MSIPISVARQIAKNFGYDQVIIIARKIDSHETVTTYGKDEQNCTIAAAIGKFLKYKVMRWPD